MTSKNIKQIIIAVTILSANFFIAPKIVFGQIIINEIMYDLAGADDKHEWVEIYNNSDAAVDLTGWKFNDGSNHILNPPTAENGGRGSLILPAGSYLLLADDATTLAADLLNYSGAIIDTVMDLGNATDNLKLITKDSTETSIISYTKDMGGAGNGRSLEWDGAALKEGLIDGGTPGQTNSILTPSGTTPGAAPSITPTPSTNPSETNNATSASGQNSTSGNVGTGTQTFDYSQNILLNEFLPNPADSEKEWVELFNAGSAAVNLSGWQIDDADNSTPPQVIPEGATIAAEGYLVITFNKSTLNNNGDKVRLLWPDDQTVHAVAYSKASQGHAVAKFDSGWLWTNQPTPGQTNKKSLTEKNETVVLAAAQNGAGQITALEETADMQTSAPPPSPLRNNAIISAATNKSISKENAAPEGGGAPSNNIDLTAAAGQPVKSSSDLITILTLTGVIVLSALAAGGLIYFKRKTQPPLT